MRLKKGIFKELNFLKKKKEKYISKCVMNVLFLLQIR